MKLDSHDGQELQRCNAETEDRWAVRAMAAASAMEARHVVLAIAPQDGSAGEALTWAEHFAKSAGLRLRTAHFPLGGSPAVELADLHGAEQATELILREAATPSVELVMLAGLPSGATPAYAALAMTLLRRCTRPLLFVGNSNPNPLVMAATDCSDPALPVLRAAWQMASVLGNQIVLVHNIDHTGSQFAERIGMPLSPELADVLALRSREWLENAAAISDVLITRDVDNAVGVLNAARRLDAGLLVVGVKPAEQAPHGTALQILMQAQRSVLFVPLARTGREATAPSQHN